MSIARVAGVALELDAQRVHDIAARLDPEPVQVHYVVIDSRRYPPKQILAAVSGLDRADFTTHQARSILRRLGFGAHLRGPVGRATGPAGRLRRRLARSGAAVVAPPEPAGTRVAGARVAG